MMLTSIVPIKTIPFKKHYFQSVRLILPLRFWLCWVFVAAWALSSYGGTPCLEVMTFPISNAAGIFRQLLLTSLFDLR
ncbi:hypothetical protein JEQ12_015311 [Ovis aries]|uniref:Uncharacterized protein n=1 Tax=Ovis aries TaxID=9940 RepID=A0A836A4P6_SHEEP|nr:hypothetical protein JEQ12_015311 [Ovis aries]